MGTCFICSSPTIGGNKLCPLCRRFVSKRLRAVKERALAAAWDKTIRKFRCYYTNLVLDVNDPKSPLYLTYDHPIPGDDTRLVVCASFVNHLKSAMTEAEFRTNIPLLADHFENGTVLDRNNFRVANFHPHPPKVRIPPELIPPEAPARGWFSETCKICGKPPLKHCLYCARCRKATFGIEEMAVKEAALISSYDKQQDGFRCHYSGMIVDLDEPPGPYHLSYDHRFPGRPGNIVICLFIINFMKSALSDEEFIITVKQLAKHFTTGEPFDLGGIKFEYWR